MVLIVIFAMNVKIYCTRSEKYSRELDISHSFIHIFATNINKVTNAYDVYCYILGCLCGGYIH